MLNLTNISTSLTPETFNRIFFINFYGNKIRQRMALSYFKLNSIINLGLNSTIHKHNCLALKWFCVKYFVTISVSQRERKLQHLK